MRMAERTRVKRCMSLEGESGVERSGLPGPDVETVLYMRSTPLLSVT